ncbi:hypothetical protein X765_26220 [Mesorhizobium sp. LSHC440B00]|nr:hypothetical protein X766_16680 [Mesorhizobium sp. LSJC255A00]ESX25282.1 hypothetical protein X765_26220 [Mesorhizobium sp. LSHC440B00]ESX36513.1 hypothetical protein X763_16400 [Mesorhizobium sp. LSHC432A00]ESX38315.1 hypothetical protein X764_22575 [Mesorhizobium sp. LSHC440A00]ESX74604.1 hypothetical protein X757_18160 [Mesorhizobium sp. LSHC414A00]
MLITPDGSVRQVAENIAFANGMAVTPDNRTLIVAESHANRLTAFDIAEDGGLSNRRVWADLDGFPDGVCLDAEGTAWYADCPHRPGAERRGASTWHGLALLHLRQTLIVGDIGLHTQPGNGLLRVEARPLVGRLDDRHDIVDGRLVFPFDNGDQVELTRTRKLLEHEILDEALLQAQQFMRCPDLAKDFFTGLGRNDEFVDLNTAASASLSI